MTVANPPQDKTSQEKTKPESRSSADVAPELERMQKALFSLQRDIEDSYYRIPKQEFETSTINNISNKVNNEMNRRISSMRNWVGVLLLVLSFFGISQWSKITEELRTDIQKDISDKILQNLDEQTKKIDTAIQSMNARIDDQIGKFSKRIDEKATDATRNATRSETERQLKEIRQDLEIAQKSVLKSELANIVSEVDGAKIEYTEAIRRLNPLLEKVINLNDRVLAEEYLDSLFRWNFLARKYENLDKLRVKYEEKFEFRPETWANIAIAGMFLYEETPSSIYKKRALSAYNRSLEKLPSYGLPHAVRLIFHMIDYERADSPEKQQVEKDEAMKILTVLNTGSATVSAYEAYSYLMRVGANDKLRISPYAQMLFDLFPAQMQTMKERSENYTNLINKNRVKEEPKNVL